MNAKPCPSFAERYYDQALVGHACDDCGHTLAAHDARQHLQSTFGVCTICEACDDIRESTERALSDPRSSPRDPVELGSLNE